MTQPLDLYDLEAEELDREVRRARVASTYKPQVPKSDPGIRQYAKDKVEEERFLDGSYVRRSKPLVAEGFPYLQRLFADLHPRNHPNMAALTRFQRLLVERGANRRRKLSAIERANLTDYGQMEPLADVPSPVRPKMSAAAAELVLKIAQSAHVAPATVLQVLIYYGFEHLSRELRERGAAPMPKEPTRGLVPAPSEEKRLIGVA